MYPKLLVTALALDLPGNRIQPINDSDCSGTHGGAVLVCQWRVYQRMCDGAECRLCRERQIIVPLLCADGLLYNFYKSFEPVVDKRLLFRQQIRVLVPKERRRNLRLLVRCGGCDAERQEDADCRYAS